MPSETASARTTLTALSALPIIHSQDTTLWPQSSTTSTPILPRMPKPYQPTPATTSAPRKAQHLTVSIKPLRPIPTLPAGSSIDLHVPYDTSIYEIKQLLGKRTGYDVGKVKVLLEKRPVGDSKTVGEVSGGMPGEVLEPGRMQVLELSAMFTGVPTEPLEQEKETGKDGSGSKVEDVDGGLKTADAASLDAARRADVGLAGGVEGGPDAVGTRDVEMTAGDGVPVAQGKSGKDVLETEEFWQDLRGFLVQRSRDEKVAEVLVGRCKEGWRNWVGSR